MKTKWQDLLALPDPGADKLAFETNVAGADPAFDELFPGRVRGEPFASRYIARLLDRLADLEAKTTPLDVGASGKDLNAFLALQAAGALVEVVAGWAIRHQIGTALEGRGFVPLGPQEARNTDAYRDAKAAVDDHRHEQLGELEPGVALRDDQVRQAIINILDPLLASAAWSRGSAPIMSKCVEAMRDINHGFPPALTDIARERGLPTSYAARRLQMSAIGFIEYRRSAKRMTEASARRAVADAYGVGESAIRYWADEFRAGSSPFGPLDLEREIQFARNAASYVLVGQEAPADERLRMAAGASDEKYGDSALARAVAAYASVRPKTRKTPPKRDAARKRERAAKAR